jgi:hypothetical protein
MWKFLSGIAAVMIEGGAFMLLPSQPKVAWALILIGVLLFVWTYILYRRDQGKQPEGTVVHNYNNSVVHIYMDGAKKSEPINIINEPAPTETSVALAIPSLEILSANNISSVSDDGEGGYTIYFDNPIEGEYEINTRFDKNVNYEIQAPAADCASIKFPDDLPERLNIEFTKIREE